MSIQYTGAWRSVCRSSCRSQDGQYLLFNRRHRYEHKRCSMFGIGVVALGVVLLGVYLRFIRPWQLRWGATDEEMARAMSGDSIPRLTPLGLLPSRHHQRRSGPGWCKLTSQELAGTATIGWIILASPVPSASSPNSSMWQSATWYRSVQMENRACGSRPLNRTSGCSGGTTKVRLPGTGAFPTG